jgi:fumarylpyruvate hydrolase
MAATVIPAPKPVLLPVEGTDDLFPVRRVYCVGRNYADHAIEMGHDPSREPPFYFQKNPDNLLPAGQDFPYPPLSSNVHYEVECVVVLKSGGADIPASEALDHIPHRSPPSSRRTGSAIPPQVRSGSTSMANASRRAILPR